MTHPYAVKPDLLKLLNLLDDYLQNDEREATQLLLDISDPASPETLLLAECARETLEIVAEQRLEVALLKRQVEREVADEAPGNTNPSPQDSPASSQGDMVELF